MSLDAPGRAACAGPTGGRPLSTPSTSLTAACPPDGSNTNHISYTVNLTDPIGWVRIWRETRGQPLRGGRRRPQKRRDGRPMSTVVSGVKGAPGWSVPALLTQGPGETGMGQPLYPRGVPGRGHPPGHRGPGTAQRPVRCMAGQVAHRRVHAETGRTPGQPVREGRAPPANPGFGRTAAWQVVACSLCGNTCSRSRCARST